MTAGSRLTKKISLGTNSAMKGTITVSKYTRR